MQFFLAILDPFRFATNPLVTHSSVSGTFVVQKNQFTLLN